MVKDIGFKNRFLLYFDEPMESEFQKAYFRKNLPTIRMFLAIATVLYPSFAVLDLWSLPESKYIAWWIRFAFVTPSIFSVYLLSYTNYFQRYNQQILSVLTAVTSMSISLMIAIAKEYELAFTNYYTGLFIVIFSSITLLRLRFMYAFATALTVTIANEYIMIFVQRMYEGGFDGWKFLVFINNNFYFLIMSSAAVAASYGLELFQRKDYLKRRMIDDEIRVIEQKNKQITQNRNKLDVAVKDLQRVQARLEAIVNNDVTGISVINRQFKYVFINRAWLKMTGYNEREFAKLNKLDLTHPEDRELTKIFFENIFNGDLKEISLEKRYLRKDGAFFWGDLYVSPIFDAYGNVESIISIVVDITQKKENEEKLVKSEQKLRQILEDKERFLNIINSELKQASQYVLSIIPEEIKEGAIKTAWKLIPSSKLGGDTLGYHWIDREHFAIYLVDACGHGVGPALHSVTILNVIRNRSLPNTDFYNPSEVLASLNKAFHMDEHNGIYITIWYGVFNIKTRILKYSSGGHPGALYLNSKGEKIPLQTNNFIVGAKRDYVYESAETNIDFNSILYVFSDGCYEFIKENDQIWGLQNLYDFLALHRNGTDFELDELYNMAIESEGGERLEDDFTILKLRIS